MGKRLQLRLLSDALTGEWRNGEAGERQAPSPVNTGDSATSQEVCHEGLPTRTQWEGYHLARPGAPPGPKGVYYPENETPNLNPHPVLFLGTLVLPKLLFLEPAPTGTIFRCVRIRSCPICVMVALGRLVFLQGSSVWGFQIAACAIFGKKWYHF